MGKNDIEPRGVSAVWPVADSSRNAVAIPAGFDQAGYGTKDVDLNLATLWRIAWAWRWLILSALGAGIGGAIMVTLLTTPTYKSTATLEINPPTVEVMENDKTGSNAPNDASFLATQYGLLESRSLAERVGQDLNLASNPVLVPEELDRATRERVAADILTDNLDVDPVPDSRLVRISYSSDDPVLAARIVNGFADSFIKMGLERRYQASSYAREFLERQISNVRRDLEKSERQLVAYAQQQGIISTAPSGENGATSDANSLTGASLVALNTALAEAQTKRIAAEQRYREALGGGATAEVSERTAALRTTRATLEAEYQDKLTVFRPDYPEMVALKSRIDALSRSINSEGSDVRAGRAGTLRAEYQAAQAEEGELRQRVGQLRGEVLNLRGRSIQYTILQRDVDTNRQLYNALLQRYKEIGVAGGIGTSQASIVDGGEIPAAPYSPNLIFNLLVGILLGLAGGIGAALLLEFVNDTIATPDDVRDRLRLAFLGGIPIAKGRKAVEDLRDSTSSISEAYFSAGTSLQFTTETGAPKTLLITSTRPAEGKSTTTWALAQHFAKLGNSVLLIDADMRKPAFVIGSEREDGLSTLLTSRDPLRPHVMQTDLEGLWLLPCGQVPPNPAELLASPRLKLVLAEAAAQFDFVIVDGPPILGLADAPLLSTVCGGTLMVVEAGKTRTRAAVEALHRLRSAGSNVVGAILTRYRHEATGYGYSYEAYTYRSVEQRDREIRAISGRDG